jgi:transposase
MATPEASLTRCASIVLLAAGGATNRGIAARLDVDVDVVSRWRKQFVAEGLAGLRDRKRSGRPRSFAAEVVAQVKAMACEPPAARAVPLSRWSSAELAGQAVAEGLAVTVSTSTVRRVAGRGCDQAVAAPVVDLSAGSWSRGCSTRPNRTPSAMSTIRSARRQSRAIV